ncbi:enoyl-CoA hydratase [Thalassovita taeanensis]|uniref:Short chain enoyl-CoA hydratase n=1 Tax=Thalassovita taeanensis TaxID=657014 RepID=A0A1H9I5N0_9RHOB|nr:enoyl-CoA hydratase [Thalassovita taeanensis]SEQ69838.1 short chain enoyl-CoA hydratase [Thalassovita taeanensis]
MTSPPEQTILYEVRTHVAHITLNRPQAMNALSVALQRALRQALQQADADPEVRVIVLTGAGDRAFTAGLDLKEISANPALLDGMIGPGAEDDPVRALAACTCPIIAAVNGFAITGGLELMLGCDVILAADTAKFADTHAAVGVIPGWGLSQKLSRLIGQGRAKEMHFGGQTIDARTACDWGLINRVVPAADLLSEAEKLALNMARHDPAMLRRYKQLIDDGYELSFQAGMQLETAASKEWNSAARPVNVADKSR